MSEISFPVSLNKMLRKLLNVAENGVVSPFKNLGIKPVSCDTDLIPTMGSFTISHGDPPTREFGL